jgi:hypothetical protein
MSSIVLIDVREGCNACAIPNAAQVPEMAAV